MKLLLMLLMLLAMGRPLRADDAGAAVKHFYADLDALSIRGNIDGHDVDRCREVLTASYREAIDSARKGLQSWRDAAKRDPEHYGNLKLPFTEGAIFTWSYESGDFTRIESVKQTGDRAYAKVRIQLRPSDGEHSWADLVVLHRVGARWLIDDILTDIDRDGTSSVRDHLVIPPTNQAKRAGAAHPATRPGANPAGNDNSKRETHGSKP